MQVVCTTCGNVYPNDRGSLPKYAYSYINCDKLAPVWKNNCMWLIIMPDGFTLCRCADWLRSTLDHGDYFFLKMSAKQGHTFIMPQNISDCFNDWFQHAGDCFSKSNWYPCPKLILQKLVFVTLWFCNPIKLTYQSKIWGWSVEWESERTKKWKGYSTSHMQLVVAETAVTVIQPFVKQRCITLQRVWPI